jgi:hypothetical protein
VIYNKAIKWTAFPSLVLWFNATQPQKKSTTKSQFMAALYFRERLVLKYLLTIFLLMSSSAFSETIEIEKTFALKMLVSSYVNGFKEFDTTVVGYDGTVSIGIYVEREGQSKERAEQLAKRFYEQVPKLLERNAWAKNVNVVVNIY